MDREEQQEREGRQRLDKWLFFSRLTKSRALAQKRISDGEVLVNGRKALQPSFSLRVGDRLELLTWRGIHLHAQTLTVRFLAERRGPFEEARHLYDDHGWQMRDDA